MLGGVGAWPGGCSQVVALVDVVGDGRLFRPWTRGIRYIGQARAECVGGDVPEGFAEVAVEPVGSAGDCDGGGTPSEGSAPTAPRTWSVLFSK